VAHIPHIALHFLEREPRAMGRAWTTRAASSEAEPSGRAANLHTPSLHSNRRATIGRWSAPLFRSAASISLHTDVATEFAPSPVRHYTVRTARVRSTRRNSMPVMKISSFDERKFGGIRLPSASPFFLE
jgi:hypothetical protein